MTYDSARSRTILFGGFYYDTTNHYLNDTWEGDGFTWSQVSSSGPPPRDNHAMAYDSARGRTVLFGGTYNDGSWHYLSDTWEWDGSSWALASSTGPPPRGYHAMAYSTSQSRVILFGGYDGSDLGDTWAWDGVSWTQVSATGPSARDSHTLTYDSARNRIVLFGGSDTSLRNDTWEWDGISWAQRTVSGPSPRQGHTTAFDSLRNRVVLFGGTSSSGPDEYRDDTWEYHGVNLGDMNNDGRVDGLDIQPFVTAVANGSTNSVDLYLADFDASGALDTADINGFVVSLLGG